MEAKNVIVRSFTGPEANRFIPELAGLRIQVFKEYPYLYQGSMAYEEDYLQTFISARDSVIVVAFDGQQIVGASTGMPMEFETAEIQKPWIEKDFDIKRIFYFGESVLQKEYRGQGIGVRFFKHRERWVKGLRRFEQMVFCSVVRPENHPLKPEEHKPLDTFWTKRGYSRTKDLVCYLSWPDLGEEEETVKPLHFWYKKIEGPNSNSFPDRH